MIACKPSFQLEANSQLKAPYTHKLWDLFYAAMACSTMQSSLEEETFTKFQGHLVAMFGGHARQSKVSATSSGINAIESEIMGLETKLSKNSRQ